MNDEVLKWLVHGETGIISKGMAAAVCGLEPDARWSGFSNHPHDPSDLWRCIKFLDAVPIARLHLGKVAVLSGVWAALIAHWGELETMCREEYPAGSAPKTYARMKELGC